MEREFIDLSDLFDVADTLTSELGEMYGRDILVQLLTNSKSLCNLFSKRSMTSDKRTMLDIAAVRDGFHD